ncbi:hypothetical protein [Phyllobacterium sophorae]|uniref:Uncharacterized protein n=1 Tax=Phyllobacterium sophorae TaxID=1520277 RepID=A0A2P7BDZ2_9HYPH|nr:hypothetical protein [Phyllobacterium sophorae]PSH64678.1 hypothetical protein CU103_12405 [Phyllobacterium sophorae]
MARRDVIKPLKENDWSHLLPDEQRMLKDAIEEIEALRKAFKEMKQKWFKSRDDVWSLERRVDSLLDDQLD